MCDGDIGGGIYHVREPSCMGAKHVHAGKSLLQIHGKSTSNQPCGRAKIPGGAAASLGHLEYLILSPMTETGPGTKRKAKENREERYHRRRRRPSSKIKKNSTKNTISIIQGSNNKSKIKKKKQTHLPKSPLSSK